MKQVFPSALATGMSQSGSYILMLREPERGIEVPVFIGAYEAQSFLLAKEEVATRRPMTHHLLAKMMDEYGLTIKQVTIDRVEDGIFYATLHVSDGFSEKRFDSRTSDAVTLAVLCGCPIMMEDSVIEETGMTVKKDAENEKMSVEELEEELKKCEENEEYERAAEIQRKIEELKSEK